MNKKVFAFRLLILLTLIIVYCFSVRATAMNTGFTIDDVSIKEQQQFLSNISLSLLTNEPPKKPFVCFDVNENGLIAIASGDSEKKYITVYDRNGIFQFGYSFNCHQSFGIQWDKIMLNIYFVRSDIAASFDNLGNNLEIYRIDDTIDNNAYWNNIVFAKEKNVFNHKYCAKNSNIFMSLFSSDYSELIDIDNNDDVTVVYDAGSEYSIHRVIVYISGVLFVVLIIVIIILQYRKKKMNPNHNHSFYSS